MQARSLSDKVPQSISSTEPPAQKTRFHIRQRAEICDCFFFLLMLFPAPSVAKNDCDAFRFKLNPMMILNNDETRKGGETKNVQNFLIKIIDCSSKGILYEGGLYVSDGIGSKIKHNCLLIC